MRFRPCIDIHDGKVKQIVGGSLKEEGDASFVSENFVSRQDAAFYAGLYRKKGLSGGHVILLNPAGSGAYEADKAQAFSAFRADPGGLQVGGGVCLENAEEFLGAGASHVIVTSYVFREGRIDYQRLRQLVEKVGKTRLVLDVSCKKKGNEYVVVTDRWQKETEVAVSMESLCRLSAFCDEFLVHAVDMEGKQKGIEKPLAALLGEFVKQEGFPVTYAGGVGSFSDLEDLERLGGGRVDVTVGSALDLFGGGMAFEKVLAFCGNPVDYF